MTKRNCFVTDGGIAIEKLADALDPDREKPFRGDILDLLEWAAKAVLELRKQLASAQERIEGVKEQRDVERAAYLNEFEKNQVIVAENARLRQQVTLLRDTLTKERDLRVFGQSVECGKTHWESIRDMRRDVYKGTEEALAATTPNFGCLK